MKKTILITTLLMFSSYAFSQMIIGDEDGSTTDKTSVLLDFAVGQNKGIILPAVTELPVGSGLAEGTILLDATNPTEAKVAYYNGDWVDLSSGNEADISDFIESQPNSDEVSKGVIIGAESSSADGVLILESTDKAMILPMVESTDDISNPAPGMMVYINNDEVKRLAVFNGSKWTFWAPN